MVDAEASNGEISSALGRTERAVASKRFDLRLVSDRLHWPIGDLAKLRAMVEARSSDSEIAATLGRTERSVASKRHALGLVSYRRLTRPPADASRWVDRARHLEQALDLALALADTRSPHDEIAEAIRDSLHHAPQA